MSMDMSHTQYRSDRGRVVASRWANLAVVLSMLFGFQQLELARCASSEAVGSEDIPARSTTVLATITSTRSTLVRTAASAATITTPGTTDTTTTTMCGAVVRCLGDTQCRQCLTAINSTVGFPHTVEEFNVIENVFESDVAAKTRYIVGFFQALVSNASCSASAISLDPAMRELLLQTNCQIKYGMIVLTKCISDEYECFIHPNRNDSDFDCRQCLHTLYSSIADGGNVTKSDVLRLPVCSATETDSDLLGILANDCDSYFPTCSVRKQQCSSSVDCVSCLTTLSAGDGAGAARQCTDSPDPAAMEALQQIVVNCIDSSPAACSFWRQLCADNPNCGDCLASMSNGDSARVLATKWSTPACQRTQQNGSASDNMNAVIAACSDISSCQVAVTKCVLGNNACISCILGESTTIVNCSTLMQTHFLDNPCEPCPVSVHTINTIVFATAIMGGFSAVVCLAVATNIVVHGHHRVSMRDRIVVGVMMANAVYSTANAIQLNALRTGVLDCGRLAMSFDTIRFGRAWWFCGKYGLVSFEMFILGASIHALYRGMLGVPRCAEAAMHVACCAIAALAFVVFYVLCMGINANGYDAGTESEAYTNAFNHANADDDLDDSEPSAASALAFTRARDAYDSLVRDMLVAWDIVVGVAVGLWVLLRVMHLHALRALRAEAAAAAQAEAADEWRSTRQSAWEARRCYLELRREAFNDVARPLEPYIVIFVLFATPAFVMSTPFCQSHSRANVASELGVGSAQTSRLADFTYGTCDVWCEFVLAFRSLGTVAVYLLNRERRAELVDVRSTWRKLCSRVVGCIYGTPLPYAPWADDHGEYQADELELAQPSDNANSDFIVAAASADLSSWYIKEDNIVKVRQLGKGSFGEVWESKTLPDGQRVAVKFMLTGVLDENGDAADLNANEDFDKECVALQRVDHPHLLKFLGFGTTVRGQGFIVTELMLGGSLEDVLHDQQRDLPWRTRTSIGLQVALGMEHLHGRHMLHRDLKSANVLLDTQFRAKVCDFGMSRLIRPSRRHFVRSPFTGKTRPLLSADIIKVGNGQAAPSVDALGFVDVHDVNMMTKAVGTMRWMAPEVFRGDQNYTKAVDVYSFGIVLWELATRRVPWVGELPAGRLELFEGLNCALQSGRRPTLHGVNAKHGAFVAVMERCWAGDPADRPTFSEVTADLAACLRNFS